MLAVGPERKKKPRQALKVLEKCSFLGEVLNGVLWEAA